jgi:hypothetical protein
MSIFFFLNYRLFLLLEREDWPALAYYLEQKIFVKNRYSDRNVRLLASSYLVISDFQSVQKLEGKALIAKPTAFYNNILIFGTARILGGNHTEAAVFFKSHSGKSGKKDKQWVLWFCGFSQLLSGAYSQAEPDFSSLAASSNNVFITGLSAYFLCNSIEKHSVNRDKCHETAEYGKARVIKAVKNAKKWRKETKKMETEIHISIIKKYIDEAGKWLFEKD